MSRCALWHPLWVPVTDALALLRPLGLLVDGPVRWGDPVAARGPGLYVIEMVEPLASAPIDGPAVASWIERVPTLLLHGRRPTQGELHQYLASFWLPETTVLYIGQAPRSVAGRIAAQRTTPLGARRPFSGAHWLRTLRGEERWRVWWTEAEAFEEYADALFTSFAERLADAADALPSGGPVLPFGDLESVTDGPRSHGITGGLVDDAAASTGPTRGPLPPRRARAPAKPRRTTTTSRRTGRLGTTVTREPAAVHLSPLGLEKARAELLSLTSVTRPEVIARVASARQLGDLRENAEYQSAREEQSFLEGRVATLESMLRNAVVIEATGAPEVSLGSHVVVESEGEERTFELVGSTEADPVSGRISDRSPVGNALMGKRAGDSVTVRLPAGEVGYRIIEVT